MLAMSLLLAACSGGRPRWGERTIVETSGKKRAWVTAEETSFREDDILYFRGQVFDATDLSLALRQAEADAKKRIVGKITEQVASEYSEYRLGANVEPGDTSAFVTDGITSASDAVALSGAAPVREYWEVVETRHEYGAARTFNAVVLVGISAEAYEAARRRAQRALEARTRAGAGRQAEEGAERLRQRLEPADAP